MTAESRPHRYPPHDEGTDADRLDYLRGPLGQHDRETIWRGAQGRIGGDGGFLPDSQPRAALRAQAMAEAFDWYEQQPAP